jgi:hypothetical protein
MLPRRPVFTVSPRRTRLVGLAHQRHVGRVAVRGHPLQHADGAVHRQALLVAGDEERDAAGVVRARLDEVGEAGEERGDASLHVAGAAAVERAVPHGGGEGVVRPALVARRHHVRVAGVAEVRRAGAAAGEEVLHLAEAQPVAREAERAQGVLHDAERAVVGRRHAAAADQRLGDGQRVRCRPGRFSHAAAR